MKQPKPTRKQRIKISIIKTILYAGTIFGGMLLLGAVGLHEHDKISSLSLILRSLIGILISVISITILEKVVNYYDN